MWREKPRGAVVQAFAVTLALFLQIPSGALSGGVPIQPDSSRPSNRQQSSQKSIHALRVADGSIDVDGHLDDAAWRNASFINEFLQKEPVQGAEPTDPMEVALVYDNTAIYVAARLYSKDPEHLRMHLDRRDSQGPAEQFILMLDTYHDRRTAYIFGVNTAGVRFERYHPTDSEYDRDYSFNPVWTARTARDAKSWTVEMRIPFSQLRFTDSPEQIWGINFNRWIPAQNEDVFWTYTPRQETGYASRFGELSGIKNVKPSRRLELLPYVASDGSFTDQFDSADPFRDGSELSGRVGGDLRMGIGPNLTLEATVSPDFGQVEADAAEVNLSAFETFFPEKRPFFSEGSQLFDAEGAEFFYSRRIGASPHGYGDDAADFVNQPSNTSILGAAKLTGRMQSGLSVGAIAAVTGREYADEYFSATNKTQTTLIEPVTFYGVTRLQQEFGADGSTAGIILTTVQRDIAQGSPLESVLRKSAYSGAGDFKLRFEGGKYDLVGSAGFSHIRGDTSIIRVTQERSAHYFQRPDASEVTFDPTRTSLSGYQASLRGGKRSGKHWLWGGGFSAESPGFELNDAGILRSANDIGFWNNVTYRETNPGNLFRNYNINLNHWQEFNYGGDHQFSNIDLNLNGQLWNFWDAWGGMSRQNRTTSDSRTRGGPLVGFESGYSWWWGFNSPFTGTTRYGLNGIYAIDELGGWVFQVRGNFTTRIGTRFQLSANPVFRNEEQPRQYVTTLTGLELDDNGAAYYDHSAAGSATFGSRYVFSRIDRSTLSMQIRANYYINPDLSIELYAEPFVATGKFFEHGQVPFAGTIDLTTSGTDGSTIIDNSDGTFSLLDGGGNLLTHPQSGDALVFGGGNFSSLSFRSNLVMRWEFTPGSALFLVWQRNLSGELDRVRTARPSDFFDTVSGDGADFFAMKFSYWIPLSG